MVYIIYVIGLYILTYYNHYNIRVRVTGSAPPPELWLHIAWALGLGCPPRPDRRL